MEDENGTERQMFLVGSPRDPLVSTGAIVATGAEEINPGDLHSSALAGLMGAQSSSVCFPAKFSKCSQGSDLIREKLSFSRLL